MRKSFRTLLHNALFLSLLIHLVVLLALFFIVLKPEVILWTKSLIIDNISLTEEKQAEPELQKKQKEPEKKRQVKPQPVIPPPETVKEPEPDEYSGPVLVPLRDPAEKAQDSLRVWQKSLKDYLFESDRFSRGSEMARFLDFDIEELKQLAKDSAEVVAELLAENWERIRLSPEQLSKIKPREDIISKRLYYDHGGIEVVPVTLLIAGGIKLAQKLISKIFSRSKPVEINYLLSITEIRIMNIVWDKRKTQPSFIYDMLPPDLPFRIGELREILNSLSARGLLAVSEGLYENYYEPTITREAVLERYMHSLYHLRTGTIDNIAGNGTNDVNQIKESLHKKILLLNQIDN